MTSLSSLSRTWLLCLATLLPAGYAPCVAADAPRRVVILGDSITTGYGLERDQAYPALLQRKADESGLAVEFVNAGVSGDTTAGGLRRIDWVLGRGADVLVIALGGNDGLRGLQPDQTRENLLATIIRARERLPDLKIVLVGMQMPENLGPRYTEEFAAIFPAIARETGVGFIPFLLEGVGGVAELNQDDQIHPNAGGQQAIARHLWPLLLPLLEP